MPTFHSYDGTALRYRLVGSGPPLVVYPGGPGRASAYLGELGGLSRTRTLVLLDSRGTGGSATPADPATYAWDRLDADVDALTAHLDLDVFDLAGHSAGTRVAVSYAARQWRRLRRLVLLTPSVSLVPHAADDTDRILQARSGEPWHRDAMEAIVELDALGPNVAPDRRQPLLARVAPVYYGRWDDAAREHAAAEPAQVAPRARAGFLAGGDPAKLAPQLAGVRVPVLVVAGGLDAGSGVSGPQAVAALFPRGRAVVLDGAGHYPWLDDPQRFVEIVEWFLA